MKQELLDKLAAALSSRFKGNYTCPVCKHEQLMQACTGLFINILHENNLDPLKFGPNAITYTPHHLHELRLYNTTCRRSVYDQLGRFSQRI